MSDATVLFYRINDRRLNELPALVAEVVRELGDAWTWICDMHLALRQRQAIECVVERGFFLHGSVACAVSTRLARAFIFQRWVPDSKEHV